MKMFNEAIIQGMTLTADEFLSIFIDAYYIRGYRPVTFIGCGLGSEFKHFYDGTISDEGLFYSLDKLIEELKKQEEHKNER